MKEFNIENIINGEFNTTKSKGTDWVKYSSIRLLEESGFVAEREQKNLINKLQYKWYYYKRISDNNTGSIIIGLHKKEISTWLYVVINPDGTYQEYKTIQEAKKSFNN